jgi:predicted protein tyrosine phosphatase
MTLPEIIVTDHDTCGYVLEDGSSYDDVEAVDIVGPFDHVISIVGTWEGDDDPPGGWEVWNAYPARKLRLVFDDVQQSSTHGDAPTKKHIQQVIDFARGTEGGRVIIHCAAGVSRSTGVALTFIATLLGLGKATEAVEHLCSIRKPDTIRPHKNIVEMADELLGYEGALVDARAKVWSWG